MISSPIPSLIRLLISADAFPLLSFLGPIANGFFEDPARQNLRGSVQIASKLFSQGSLYPLGFRPR
jgi:hypothetical protein